MRPSLSTPDLGKQKPCKMVVLSSEQLPQGSGSDAEGGGDSGDDSDAGEDFVPMDADGEEAPPKKEKAAKKGRLKRDSQPGEHRPRRTVWTNVSKPLSLRQDALPAPCCCRTRQGCNSGLCGCAYEWICGRAGGGLSAQRHGGRR